MKGNAHAIKMGLEQRGIFIRHFDNRLLSNMLRISVGKPEHTEALLEALERWKEL
jgi:histidinol-phosphate aminotransferase